MIGRLRTRHSGHRRALQDRLALLIAVAVWLLLGVGYSGLPSVPAAAG